MIYLADKPNHELQYNIGTDFCIEDPTNVNFHLMVVCQLKGEPEPPPNFHWTITLNETKVTFDDLEDYGLSANTELNDNLVLTGIIMVGFDQNSILNVTCFVENSFGSDTKNSSISICSKSYPCRPFIYKVACS